MAKRQKHIIPQAVKDAAGEWAKYLRYEGTKDGVEYYLVFFGPNEKTGIPIWFTYDGTSAKEIQSTEPLHYF